MKDPEHMSVKYKYLPDDIRATCIPKKMKTPDDCMHIKIQKVIAGLT